jgi:MbtH protein
MTKKTDTGATCYKVISNDYGLYSIWPADRENARGWQDAGKTGTAQECVAYIEEVWTDTQEPGELKKGVGLDAFFATPSRDMGIGRKDNQTYKLIENRAGEYLIWPENSLNMLGWHNTDKSGTKEECISYLLEMWKP